MNKSSYRHLISEIAYLFFRPREFKVFEISSGGWFVSLGLTTSVETLEKLKNVYKNSDYGFESKLVRVRSVKSLSGSYINEVYDETPEKFYSGDLKPGYKVLGIESKKDYPEIAKSIEESPGSWNDHGILVCDGKDPVVYYKRVNYKKLDDGTELRLGIYVNPGDDID